VQPDSLRPRLLLQVSPSFAKSPTSLPLLRPQLEPTSLLLYNHNIRMRGLTSCIKNEVLDGSCGHSMRLKCTPTSGSTNMDADSSFVSMACEHDPGPSSTPMPPALGPLSSSKSVLSHCNFLSRTSQSSRSTSSTTPMNTASCFFSSNFYFPLSVTPSGTASPSASGFDAATARSTIS
jgi:hypothetical protein